MSPSEFLERELESMLKEVFLFARPEDKPAIERALISVMGPMYTVMPVLGRGSKGGVEYGTKIGSPVARLFSRPALSSFLPKVAYYVVVDEGEVESLLTAVCRTLASEGGPSDCGRGLAFVCPIDGQYAIRLEPLEQDDKSEDAHAAIRSTGAQSR